MRKETIRGDNTGRFEGMRGREDQEGQQERWKGCEAGEDQE